MKHAIVVVSLIIIGLSLEPSENHSLGLEKRCRRHRGLTKVCLKLANRFSVTNESKLDLAFFGRCIAKYYCFAVTGKTDRWTSVPTFKRRYNRRGRKEEEYFKKVAKRVELFFIRNNDWRRTVDALRSREKGDSCTQLLHVVAARYLYVVYVMRLLSDEFDFHPCRREGGASYVAPTHGACFIPPQEITCYSDYEIELLGGRSGTLTGLFNQFFREPLGKDQIVPGFGKSAEVIFGASVVAFQLEYSMPDYFVRERYRGEFKDSVIAMQMDIKYQMLEIVVAIYKMRIFKEKYFHDFMSDRVQLRSKPILAKIFQGWTVQLKLFDKKINSFVDSPHYAKDLSFRRRNNIGYELVVGTVESAGIPWWRMLAEDAMALMHNSECYMTRSATRHAIGEVEMKLKLRRLYRRRPVDDYWASMLENWADANKKYKRECVENNLEIQVCLLKMSKYLWRMLEAMYSAKKYLQRVGLASGLLDVDENGLRSIVRSWENDLRRQGVTHIPMPPSLTTAALSKLKAWKIGVNWPPRTWYVRRRLRRRRMSLVSRRRRRMSLVSRRRRTTLLVSRRRRASPSNTGRVSKAQAKKSTTSIQQFLTSFKCHRRTRDIPLVMRMEEICMDAIHSEIRKYNRKLFLNKARSWRVNGLSWLDR